MSLPSRKDIKGALIKQLCITWKRLIGTQTSAEDTDAAFNVTLESHTKVEGLMNCLEGCASEPGFITDWKDVFLDLLRTTLQRPCSHP